VAALLQTFIDNEPPEIWSLNPDTNPLFYKAYIVGDEHTALIALNYKCPLCGHGTDSVYTYDQGKWRELYGLCDWHS
jgi:hypothetical protein